MAAEHVQKERDPSRERGADRGPGRPTLGFRGDSGAIPWRFLAGLGVVALAIGLMIAILRPNGPGAGTTDANTVVAYVAQDQVYAEPILARFTRDTGIRVRAVYDAEAVKTVGLVNRILAERHHPQCDLFWGNEEFRTRQLAAQGVFRETNGWAAMGWRSRRLIVNTNLLPVADAPASLIELTNRRWRGKVTLAYPLFGTTATHFLALRQQWGPAAWEAWCRALVANEPFVVDGNSTAARFVARGEAWIGLTDSDDLAAEQRNGAPMVGLPLTPETLLIPNTIGVIRGARHPEAAQQLFEYLQRPAIVHTLVAAQALEAVELNHYLHRGLQPDWTALLHDLDAATDSLKRVFLR